MGFIAGINRIIQLFGDTFRQFFRGRIWLILLGYYVLQFVVLYAHEQFASPVFGWLASLTLTFKDANRAVAFTHYPTHYVFLPDVYGNAKLVVGLFFEGLTLGAVAAAFQRRFSPKNSGVPAKKLWLQLVVAWVALNALTMVMAYVVPALLASQLYSPKRIAVFSFIIMPALFTVCMALFYYSIPIVMMTGRNGFYATGQALKLFFRFPVITLVLSALIVAGPVLVAAISSGYATTIVDKFRPELVYWLLVVGLLFEMIASFFWMGTASRLLVDELE